MHEFLHLLLDLVDLLCLGLALRGKAQFHLPPVLAGLLCRAKTRSWC